MKNKKKVSLTFRLLRVVCLTFIPLNFAVIILSAAMVENISAKQLETLENGLGASITPFENSLERVCERMEIFVVEYLSALTVMDGNDTMTSYEMIEEMYDVLSATNMTGFVTVYEKKASRLFLKYTPGAYSVKDIEETKKILRAHENGEYLVNQWYIRNVNSSYYYSINYEYENYHLAYYLDMQMIFSELLKDFRDDAPGIYLACDEVELRMEDRLTEVSKKTWKSAREESFSYYWMEWQSQNSGLNVGIRGIKSTATGWVRAETFLLVAVAGTCIVLLFIMWQALKKNVVMPLALLHGGMKKLENNQLDYRIDSPQQANSLEFEYIYESFNHMAEEIMLSHEKDIKMYQAQLDNLRLQVNPHMLLNSFNMIYSLAQTKNYECIQDFSLHLVDYFRYVLRENDQMVPLKKEMKFVESYIGIQKIRFPKSFTSVYRVEEGLEEVLVPPLLIENFVENAMKYALVPGRIIEVLINIRSEDDRLLISICDTGSGIKEEALEAIQKGEIYLDKRGQKHIGIWNCRRRMEVFYGESARMNIVSSRGEGTQVWLDVPLMRSYSGEVTKDELAGGG